MSDTHKPYALSNETAYQAWREQKLAHYPRRVEDLIVEVKDPRRLSASEAEKLRGVCGQANMAIYASPLAGVADKNIPRQLGAQLGLHRLDTNMLADEDGISAVRVVPEKSGRGYIPYSNQRLLWHTDGYYNAPQQRINAFVLHCVMPAQEGGVNQYLDHDIAYILLRDAHPDFCVALEAHDAMTIPANTEAGIEERAARAASAGAVFSNNNGSLHMRYTSRTRSIVWRQDAATLAAVQFLENLLKSDSPYVFTHKLIGGQGVVCNNVLHNRSAFTDAVEPEFARLLYRARYYDRIAGCRGGF